MSLLTITQRFCERTNLTRPNAVIGSSDKQVLQIKALLEEIGIDLNSRATWQATTFEASHTSIAAEDQGAMATIAGAGWEYVKNMTLWSRTRRLPILGPLTGIEWQALKALAINGPEYQFRILDGHLLVNPAPAAGEDWVFEYGSKYWIVAANGTTYKEFFTVDTDVPVFPEGLMIQGLRWAWKREKGLDYAEDFRMYETQVKDVSARDGGKPILRLDNEGFNGPRPGIWVSPGSWNL